MATKKPKPVVIPAIRPFTRVPIKPVSRHRDKKNDFARTPKHRKSKDEDSD